MRGIRVALGVALAISLVAGGAGAPLAALAQDGSPAPGDLMEWDPGAFDTDSAVVDNRYLPLVPGTRWVMRGSAELDGEGVRRRVVTTVTDLLKRIGGVDALVLLEEDYNDGELIEKELAFRAQDRAGNVWHLGEYTETWEGEDLVGGQAWMVGHLDGAHAGILVPARPRTGRDDFSEGYAPPPYNWSDRGRVVLVGGSTRVRAGDYDDVIIIEESDQADPEAFQLKYYAADVGPVRVGWRGRDDERETLQLVSVEQLDADGLAAAREEALELETRAYVYGSTPPARQVGAAEAPSESSSPAPSEPSPSPSP